MSNGTKGELIRLGLGNKLTVAGQTKKQPDGKSAETGLSLMNDLGSLIATIPTVTVKDALDEIVLGSGDKIIEEMRKKTIHVVSFVDNSWSMKNFENATMGGFQTLLEGEREQNTRFWTYLFAKYANKYHHDIIAAEAPTLNYQIRESEEFYWTRCYDTVIEGILEFDKKYPDETNVIFMVNTDGKDNISRRGSELKDVIAKYVIGKGRNIRILADGNHIGLDSMNREFGFDKLIKDPKEKWIADYTNEEDGMRVNFQVLQDMIYSLRTTGIIPSNWAKRAEDHKIMVMSKK